MSTQSFKYDDIWAQYGKGVHCPDDFSFPSHVIDKWAAKDDTLRALHWVAPDFSSERVVTYAELSRLTKQAAMAFKELGIRHGDRVMIQLPRVVEWWIVVLGLMRLGAIAIPGTSLLVSKDLKMRAEASSAVAFVGGEDSCKTFEEISNAVGVKRILQINSSGNAPVGSNRVDLLKLIGQQRVESWKAPSLKSSDIAIIYFTSGTTGPPKMVLLDAQYTIGHTISGVWYRLIPGKCYLNLGDLGWAKAAYATFGAFNMGAHLLVQQPPPGAFSHTQLLETLHRYPVETMCAPPTAYRSLLTTAAIEYMKKSPPKALNHCVSAGEPMNAAVIKAWQKATGITICDGWGQSETVILVGNFEGVEVRPGSMGRAAPGFEIGVVGVDRVMGPGEEGELCVRTDQGSGKVWNFKGYLKAGGVIDRREKVVDGKTWYCTGDRGIRDKDGYYWFLGRADDVITSSGYRIGPFEVESTLKEHPAVLESAAVASPHVERGEIVKAFIIPAKEYEEKAFGSTDSSNKLIAELQTYCRKATSPHKYPREIEFVRELPKTVSGKIQRVDLRNLEYQRKADVVKQRSKL